MITVKTEKERKPAAIAFVENQIEELDRIIRSCDCVEDVNGNLIYEPGSYPLEKREYQHIRRQWEILLDLLTNEPPFTMLDW